MALDKAGHDRRSVVAPAQPSCPSRGEGARRPLPAASPSMNVRSLSTAILYPGPRSANSKGAAREEFDREYLFARLSGPQNFGRATIIGWCHPDIGGEEAGESALRREAEIEADIGDRRLARHQRFQRLLHHQRIEIEVRGNAGLGAEQPVEMRPRQAGFTRDGVELDLGARALRHHLDTLAHAKIGDGTVYARIARGLCLLPALVVTDVDQPSQLAIEAIERWSAAHEGGCVLDMLVQCHRPRELGAAKAKAVGAGRIGREPLRV